MVAGRPEGTSILELGARAGEPAQDRCPVIKQGTGRIPERADHGAIRRNNLEVVLRHLSLLGPASRATIAKRTGLSPATVSRLVAELAGLHLVREIGLEQPGRAGRPGARFELDRRHLLALGAEINVYSLTVIVTDLAGSLVSEHRQPLDALALGPHGAARSLAVTCQQVVQSLGPTTGRLARRVTGIGIAVPGLVHNTDGVVDQAPNLGWRDFSLADELSSRLHWPGVPITVGNDADLAVQAEYFAGAYSGAPNLAYLTGDVGIGGGFIVEGRPLLGPRGQAGEVGHMTVDPSGPTCACGRTGCWEARIGLAAFLKSVKLPLAAGTPPEQIAGEIAERASQGDPEILSALEELGRWIGLGAANLVNILGTEVILLGGYFCGLSEWILGPARATLRQQIMSEAAAGCLLTGSTLGYRAAALGGAIHAVDRVLSNPALLRDNS